MRGKAQRKAAVVPVGPHDGVERDFQHDLRFHLAHESMIHQGVCGEPRGEFRDFLVGQSRVGFADIEQLFAVADGEGVVAEHAGTLAMAELGGSHDHVERSQFALQLEPRFPATPDGVGGVARP